jgi:protein-S-isoprenylcysteine O-methyltransferase Ste14
MSDMANFVMRFILFAVAHSLFATAQIKNIFHVSGSRGYRLSYNVASLALFGWVMSAYRNSSVLYFAHGTWSLFMYLLQLIVVAILFVCLKQTGAGEFLGLTKKTTNTFTSAGWYSIVRHPLYFFSILFMVLNPVMTLQWLLLTIMGTVYFILGSLIEERRLTVEFGEVYRNYQQRTPFLIPNLAKLRPTTQSGTNSR